MGWTNGGKCHCKTIQSPLCAIYHHLCECIWNNINLKKIIRTFKLCFKRLQKCSKIKTSRLDHRKCEECLKAGKSKDAYIDVYGSAANWSLGQIFRNSIQISLIIVLFFILGFQKRIASIPLTKIPHTGDIESLDRCGS